MTFDPNIPLPTESPSTSASPIQVDFSQFSGIFSKLIGGVFYNHLPFNNFNQGKHGAVIMQNQTVDPEVNQDFVAIYSKSIASTFSTEPQLFAKIQSFLPTAQDRMDATNTPMQMTYNKVNLTVPIYQSFLIGGYLIYFGSTNTIGTQITLTPTPSKILNVQAVSQGTSNFSSQTNVPYDSTVIVTQPDKIKINSSRAPAASNFLWMAIAKQ